MNVFWCVAHSIRRLRNLTPTSTHFFAIRHYLFELCTHMSHSLAEAHVCQLPTKDDRNEADFCISMPFKLNFIFISHSCGCDIHSTYEMENVRCFFASFDKWQFANQHRIRYVTVRIAEYSYCATFNALICNFHSCSRRLIIDNGIHSCRRSEKNVYVDCWLLLSPLCISRHNGSVLFVKQSGLFMNVAFRWQVKKSQCFPDYRYNYPFFLLPFLNSDSRFRTMLALTYTAPQGWKGLNFNDIKIFVAHVEKQFYVIAKIGEQGFSSTGCVIRRAWIKYDRVVQRTVAGVTGAAMRLDLPFFSFAWGCVAAGENATEYKSQ